MGWGGGGCWVGGRPNGWMDGWIDGWTELKDEGRKAIIWQGNQYVAPVGRF